MTEEQFKQIICKVHAVVLGKHADVAIINWLTNENNKTNYDALSEDARNVMRAAAIVAIQHAMENVELITNELFMDAKTQGVTPEDILNHMGVKVNSKYWDKL